MTASIEIRAYVVGFGDCILLRLPDKKQTRHVLVDFGRAPNDAVSLERFPAIARDIAATCNGHLDLVVVTHEHLDHMEGFYREREIFDKMDIDRIWMGLPSHPDYYADYPKAKLQKRLHETVSSFADSATKKGLVLHPAFRSLLINNLSNKDRIDYLRGLGKQPPLYLARGKGAGTAKWSPSIRVRVLAPEKDTSVYYGSSGRTRAFMDTLARQPNAAKARRPSDGFAWDFANVARGDDGSLPGCSASDFHRLRRAIREEGVAAARFLDKAQNNTSLCLLIEAVSKRLLLPGDAELESWEKIRQHSGKDLKPVDFMKVSHHGSHNGTPLDLLDTLLPVKRAGQAKILVSTKRNIYGTKNPVPDTALLTELRRRCSELVTTDGAPGTHVDLTL
ncbi:hypothetical protein HIV01_012335 [Lysobacter arenosi]|uniref:Metallo-beta-lactamase domain-containing protein n=1 Tax=Lysobacter arenosi TaxID=2795387 RepID=A0ABX7R8C9_9GAMM|nr:hypothetical protein [Lysobacter arenosi]QSX74005.1 hypothetical protein HIV01_012335 [Lysobacter arenosi]